MKKVILIAFSILICSCSKNVDLSPDSIEKLQIESSLILNKYPEEEFFIDFSEHKLIKSLEPIDVYALDSGLYIPLNKFFVTEGGFFVLREGKEVDTSIGNDPEYTHVGKRVYRYKIKG